MLKKNAKKRAEKDDIYFKSVSIPNNVTSIGDTALGTSLSTLIIGDGITEIGSQFNMSPIENLVIGKNVTSIGYNAFGYNLLKSVIIPSSVKSVGSGAFYPGDSDFTRLKEIIIEGKSSLEEFTGGYEGLVPTGEGYLQNTTIKFK